MQFVTLSPEEFTKFANSHRDKSFFQTTKIAALREQNGWQAHYVGVKNGEKILAASLIVSKTTFLGHKTFYAPGGPLIDFENQKLVDFFVKNLKTYLKKHRALSFRAEPYYELIERDIDGKIVENGFNHQNAVKNLRKLGFKTLKNSEQPKYLFAIDINGQKSEELFENFKNGTKNKINGALKREIKVEKLSKSELPRFKKITEKTSERRGFTDKTLKYYETMYDLFGDQVEYLIATIDREKYRASLKSSLSSLQKELENLKKRLKNPDNTAKIQKLTEAKTLAESAIEETSRRLAAIAKITEEGIDLAASMFILYGDEIIYLFSGAEEEYMKLDAPYAIQWEMIQYAAKKGYKRYNFYGIQGLPDPKKKDYGVYEFKRGFNGHVIELIGALELPISPVYYLHRCLSRLKNLF